MPSHPAIYMEAATMAASSARAAMAARKRRETFFNPAMFGEPAWDLLLTLCAFEREQPSIQLSALAQLSGTPPTTALRWLSYLEAQELVARSNCEHDHRAQLVELTDRARGELTEYFAGVTVSLRS